MSRSSPEGEVVIPIADFFGASGFSCFLIHATIKPSHLTNQRLMSISKNSILIILAVIISFFFVFPQRVSAVAGLPMSGPLTPYGGKINFTINCEDQKSCVPPNQFFPICLMLRCFLQVPGIIQEFGDLKSAQSVDAFDKLRDNILEPEERNVCMNICAPYYNIGSAACPAWCHGVLRTLQATNTSPVGLATKLFKQMARVTVGKPGIAIITFPVMSTKPACNSYGYVLGQGMGQGLYITSPSMSAGDSCRGSYYY